MASSSSSGAARAAAKNSMTPRTVAAAADREGEGGAQARGVGGARARQRARMLGGVGDPRRPARLPHLAGQALAGGERHRPARSRRRRRRRSRRSPRCARSAGPSRRRRSASTGRRSPSPAPRRWPPAAAGGRRPRRAPRPARAPRRAPCAGARRRRFARCAWAWPKAKGTASLPHAVGIRTRAGRVPPPPDAWSPHRRCLAALGDCVPCPLVNRYWRPPPSCTSRATSPRACRSTPGAGAATPPLPRPSLLARLWRAARLSEAVGHPPGAH